MLAQQLSAATANIEWTFAEWMAKHNKSYETLNEYKFRLNEFLRSEHEIITHRYNTPDMTYTVGHNEFSDWTLEEKDRRAGGEMDYESMFDATPAPVSDLQNLSIKSSINWCGQGACNTIQNQGHCGSCWAFAGTAVMEGRDFLKHGSLKKGSEQMCVDCASDGSCDGGYQSSCYNVSTKYHGLDSAGSYPYKGYDQSCRAAGGSKRMYATTYHHVTKYSEKAMLTALQSGPISMYVNSKGYAFDYYDGGIMNDKNCGTKGNHFIAAVGYGTTSDGKKYWKVRNSWGKTWGENGYGRILRTGEDSYGICGVQQYCEYPDMY